jgi:FixJ family two-component response regulator
MPKVDGMWALNRLRERGDATPVVILTAHGSIPDAVTAMKLGAADFLSKPMRSVRSSPRSFAEVVARLAQEATDGG